MKKEFSVAVGLGNEYVTFCFDEEKLNGDNCFY